MLVICTVTKDLIPQSCDDQLHVVLGIDHM